jgi:TPP-dependent pyruvate/acetoin dehydrogenase alpha subunit
VEDGKATAEEVQAIHDAVDAELEEAVEFAKNSPEMTLEEFSDFVGCY